MAYRPSTSQAGNGQQPPYTASTDASYDYDHHRPSTSAGGPNAQWSYPGDSRPTTSSAGPAGRDSSAYRGPEYIEEEDEEEYEDSEDEDVFTYLPPDTTQQQQLQQLQNAQAAQRQAQQRAQASSEPAQFAYSFPGGGTDTPASLAYPATTTASTQYTPASPLTPSSAVPLQHLTSFYGHHQPVVPTQSVVSSPPDTTSTAPPFAYDVPPPDLGAGYEAYGMAPITSGIVPPASQPSSRLMVDTSAPGSREVRVSLPTTGVTNTSRRSADTNPHLVASSTVSSHQRNHSLGEDEMGLRYRPDSKRTKGSSSADSVELRNGRESVKTDISYSNTPYTATLPSTPGGHTHAGNMYLDEDAEDSPFPEVRASVSNTDDPEMPAMTFRSWFVGIILCILASGLNLFFNFRYPAPYVAPLILLLLGYPFGKFLAYVLPIYSWALPASIPLIGGAEFSFNPGPFNIKEHVLIYIMANVSINPAYGMNLVVAAEKFYHFDLGMAFTFLFVVSTQLTGFALSGLCRRFLVWPASLIWPANLVTCTLLNTLHAEEDESDGGGISRYKFFLYVATAAFCWFFLPGFLFTALSVFSWICWIKPHNILVNQLFGVSSGLGMGIFAFDWNQISYIGSPLMIPWWAEVHIFVGFVLLYWIICPALYYNNVWDMSYFPISGNSPFDRFGMPYNVSAVLTPDFRLNVTAYEAYSPLYLPATYAITYLLAFTLSTAVLIHTALYHGKALINGVKRMRTEDDDIHVKLMRNYPEVPDWWYLLIFTVFFLLAVVSVKTVDTDTPVWALFLAVLIPIVYIIPSSYIFAMTGQPVAINLVAEIVPGMLLQGKPIANMIFKCFSVQTMQVALAFTQDLKLGHYMKVPPRATFMVQAIATAVTALVQIGVKELMFATIPDLCDPNQPDRLVCPNNQVFFSASAVWGLIGPQRQFGRGSVYHPELWALLIGVFLPIPFWLWQRRYPKSRVKYINTPVLLNGPTFIPPATGINFSSWFLVAFIFQYIVRTRNFRWWSKFNYILSAALDSGTIISVIFVFLTLQFPKGGVTVNWWGNNVYVDTDDWNGMPYRQAPAEGF